MGLRHHKLVLPHILRSIHDLITHQTLYFDRYTKLLAPGLDVVNDERIRSRCVRKLISLQTNLSAN